MEKKLFDDKNKINTKQVNEVVNVSKKILNLLYYVMIIAIIFLVTLLAKEWGILTFLVTVLKVATPFFIGYIIAWLFNPLVIKLQDKGVKRGLGAAIVYVCFIAILFLFFWILIPTIYQQLNDLISSFPSIIDSVRGGLSNMLSAFEGIEGININDIENNIFKGVESFITDTSTNLPQTILNSIGTIFSGIGTIAISLVMGIYMLIDFGNIRSHLIKLLPPKNQTEISNLLNDIGTELRKYANGTLFVAFMVFVGDSIGFVLVDLKAPILFALLCGITDLIPFIGPYIGGIAAVIVGFSQSPVIGIITIIVVCLVQCLENYVLQPVVMSKTMKLHPVTIIIGLLLFGHFFGIVGMILATPTLALCKVIYHFVINKYNIFGKIESN